MPTITDATVVAQAYDTSWNGGRKVVMKSDGKIYVSLKSGNFVYIYKSVDNMSSWSLAKTINTGTAVLDVSIATDGKNLFLIHSSSSSVTNISYDSNDQQIYSSYVDSSQTGGGNISLAINEAKTELHATWASKSATYPNSFNIRYAKGTINADGTVAWGAVEQVTMMNSSSYPNFAIAPSIVLINNNPYIAIAQEVGSFNGTSFAGDHAITLLFKGASNNTYLNPSWNFSKIYAGNGYAQSSPSAIYVPQSINGLANGLIANVWYGTDSASSGVNYIRFSKSADLGVNWSTMQKLVVGTNATLTANKSGKLFITYEDAGVTKRIESTDNGDTWSSATTVGTGINPSSLFDLTMNMTAPLTIRKGTSSVLFSGAWTVTTISVTPGDIGQKTDRSSLLAYSITTDGEMSTITEKINGTVVNTRTATSGQAVKLGLTQEQWDAIRFGRYADGTGGKNTLTVEMGGEKWTYTFDKRLATDADVLSAVKATQDSNEVYLPAVKKQLADAINAKGGSVSANADWLTMIDGVANEISNKRFASGTTKSSTSTLTFPTQTNGTYTTYPLTVTGLTFTPSHIYIRLKASNNNTGMVIYSSTTSYPCRSVANIYAPSTNLYVNETGFQIPCEQNGQDIEWFAYE